ncbi:hypothetical protein [Pseudoalteromonas luteoviolacea]|uniref:Uncharacterized protein n=1 Tax=Pseudoalteromonas luteoviolacea S4054 TaxID=1129367 RepID=A0A0F6ACF2_9GAMM|nr:hypothetical protein [Pseudoalteromonas luteoviolacea]AOT08497.1 hypothetical protein S4054249_11855 [Pseudoalteromonas luteoviolacea]AOT13413.1 hypothetical protein S40542_11830 [Pseudoalteromonas luteoviolacea]AOT18326.1 hypothetical protein S4054_11830 [Pseudoalteromonas luteoviolacea]KKE83506.1 hypothetical protein N479_14135 [Pseudoalteromonas luteoviolacea S4054]KZN75943.1 hypothetical protein N481_06230 [Pseudoalteromonas luteoviolacea S4047-1]
MLKISTLFFEKIFEWHLYFLGYLVFLLLYLQIVIVPIFFMGLLGTIAYLHFDHFTASILIVGCLLLGLLVGLYWAERTRRGLGIITFHAYLLSTPEIDGHGAHLRRATKKQHNKKAA